MADLKISELPNADALDGAEIGVFVQGGTTKQDNLNNVKKFFSNVVNVKDFSAKGDGSTDDTTAIQNAIDSVSGDNIVLYFPNGVYVTTTQISLWNEFTYIKVFGDNAIIQPTMSDDLPAFRLGSNDDEGSPVYPKIGLFKDMNFDLVNSVADSAQKIPAVRFDSFLGALNVLNCNIYNFQEYNSVGFQMLNIGNPVGAGNNLNNGFVMSDCNFWNDISYPYDYADNNTRGIAIEIGGGGASDNDSEYWVTSNCNFHNVYKSHLITAGANGQINGGTVQQCNSVQSGGGIDNGIIEVHDTGGTNQSKLTISNVKMNHNFSTIIWSDVDHTNRPIKIHDCLFIANAYAPIRIKDTDCTTITNNFFDRSDLYSSFLNPPAFGTSVHIFLLTSEKCMVSNNTFLDGAYRAVSSSSTNCAVFNNIYTSGLTEFTNMVNGVSGNTVKDNWLK